MAASKSDISSVGFGSRLRIARERSQVTPAEVSKMLGVSAKTYSRWEAGHGKPRANRLPIIAGTLNVPMRWLMPGEGKLGDPDDDQATREKNRELLNEVRAIKETMDPAAERLAGIEARLRKIAKRYAAQESELEPFP
ncbi:MAG: helix-turn-helix transcriptional regulator [Sulfitobacter sp.]